MQIIEMAGWVALGFVPTFTILGVIHAKLKMRLYKDWITVLEAKTFDS
jgi:hypothetical protein